MAMSLAMLGCPPAPKPSEGDEERLIRKLEEAARQVPPPPREAPNEALAELATGGRRQVRRKLPPDNPTVHLGTVALRLAGLTTTHQVTGGKISLTTEDLFLRVDLLAQNVGERPVSLDFSSVQLRWPGTPAVGVARDAQLAAGTRPLQRSFAPNDRQELVFFFEIPDEALQPGLRLVFPPAVGAGEVRIPLQ